MSRTTTERDCAAATCATCIFGRGITIEDKNRKGEVVATREMAECHVARPTRFGFPTVRPDDFCALHVDAVKDKFISAIEVATYALVLALPIVLLAVNIIGGAR